MGLNLVGGWLVWGQGCITWAISCCLHRCCCCWTMNWPCIHSSGYAWAGGQPTATAPRATSPAAACPGRCADHDWACTAPADHSYPHAPCGSCCGICMEWSAVFSVQCSVFKCFLFLFLFVVVVVFVLHCLPLAFVRRRRLEQLPQRLGAYLAGRRHVIRDVHELVPWTRARQVERDKKERDGWVNNANLIIIS